MYPEKRPGQGAQSQLSGPQYQQLFGQQYPAQYQQPAPQPPQPQAPPPPWKDAIVAEEFKRYASSISWTVTSHQQQPGQHVIQLAPPAGRKLSKGDVKRASVTLRFMGPQPPAPGTAPSGANTIQVTVETEEKAGFFGTTKKSYPPYWLNADEEVDAQMRPSPGLAEKIRNIMTQAKVTLPPAPMPLPQPQPAQQPAAQPAPQYPQPQPAQQPSPQPAPQYPQPAYYSPQTPPPTAPGYAPAQPPAQWPQPQPVPQQPQAPQPGYQLKVCPSCQYLNPPNAVACHRCGARV
ncbi:MAG: zinc ribbon domain-containing protein [Thermoplasmata archaeon]